MPEILLIAGIAFVGAAIVGGRIKAHGYEFLHPLSLKQSLLAGTFGLILLVSAVILYLNTQADLTSLLPRTLSSSQRAKLIDVLRTSQGSVLIGANACGDCSRYQAELVKAFQDAGWVVFEAEMLGVPMPPPEGLAVILIRQPPNDKERLVTGALGAAGIRFSQQYDETIASTGVLKENHDRFDVELRITDRLN